ncbi:MAG: His/Gly/Thr/Pro-type tRNA ligase C-terminal domain-containing protein, partial [Patescibacteria group bacterium]
REDKTAGEKFADADLIGCPVRIVVSKKTLEKDSVEFKRRNEKDSKLVKLIEITKNI